MAATKVSLEKLVPEKLIDEVAQLRFKHQLLHELNALFLKRQKSSNLIQEVAFAIEAELKLRTAFSMFEMVHNGKDITNSDPELYAKVYRNISVITPPNPS